MKENTARLTPTRSPLRKIQGLMAKSQLRQNWPKKRTALLMLPQTWRRLRLRTLSKLRFHCSHIAPTLALAPIASGLISALFLQGGLKMIARPAFAFQRGSPKVSARGFELFFCFSRGLINNMVVCSKWRLQTFLAHTKFVG